MPSRTAAVAAPMALLLLAAGVLAVGGRQQRHMIGSNLVRPITFIAVVPGGKQVCQPATVPQGTGGVGLRIGTYGRPGPALRLSIDGRRGDAVRGALVPGWRQGDVVVPVSRTGIARRDARLCVRNAGRSRMAFAGGPGVGAGARVGRRNAGGQIRIEYVEPDARSWWSVAPAMAHRLAVVRDAFPGRASLWLFALLTLGVTGGALALALRESRR